MKVKPLSMLHQEQLERLGFPIPFSDALAIAPIQAGMIYNNE